MGKLFEEKCKNGVFGLKCGKMGRFLRPQLVSDSVIRWFESSYPSQKGQIWAKTGSDLLFFCILAEKDAVFECSMLGIGK